MMNDTDRETLRLTDAERETLANEVLGRADSGRWDAVERIVAAHVEQAIADARAEGVRQAKAAVEAELQYAEGHARHVIQDEVYAPVGSIRAALSDLGGDQ